MTATGRRPTRSASGPAAASAPIDVAAISASAAPSAAGVRPREATRCGISTAQTPTWRPRPANRPAAIPVADFRAALDTGPAEPHTLAAVGVVEVEPSGPERAGVVDKGLKKDALGFVSSVVIGVASTAPGYSLAASLGFVVAVAGIGLQAPAVLLLAFVPMLLIASAYYYMNRADPDCGTTFSWVTQAMGPSWGWLGGWAIIVADVIVMANLAQIAGLYSFLLVGWESAAESVFAVTAVGVVWIAVMTTICVIGIELSARTQVGLLGAEILTLARSPSSRWSRSRPATPVPTSVDPSLSWLNPLEIDSFDALVSGVLIAIFIYWGWDSTVTVNEESRDSTRGSGQGGADGDRDPASDLRDRRVRRAGVRRDAATDRQRRRRAERARRARSSARRSTRS